MEPVTHVLTGVCLAHSGFHRRTAHATVAMATAAELPDIDTLWSLRGPVSGFQHHRGITHTLLGIPFEAALVVGLVYVFHRWRAQRGRSPQGGTVKPQAPVHWGWLYTAALLALLSHILLDFTNNYGVRPFFPFNARWYAASIVFIFDPLIFLVLLAGLLLPLLFGLVGQEIASKQQQPHSSGWPRIALLTMLVIWGLRAWEHASAVHLAMAQTLRAPAAGPPGGDPGPEGTERGAVQQVERPLLQAKGALASPDPFNPFRWSIATDYGSVILLAAADTLQGSTGIGTLLYQPGPAPLTQKAERTHLGRVYRDWSPMPWIHLDPDLSGAERGDRTVLFEDVRFMGNQRFLQRGGPPPLTGEVILSSDGRIVAQGLDAKFGN